MKNFPKYLILLIVAVMMTGGFATRALAQTSPNLTVEFEKTPLFSETNFTPGDSVSRTIKITNKSSSPKSVAVKAVSVENSGDHKLGDVVRLVIKQGDSILYNDTFTAFFNSPKVVLSQAPGNNTQTTFSFIATFKPETRNDYQNSTMKFNLQIGFENGENFTDTTVSIGGQQGSGGGGGGGGGGGNGPLIVGQKNLIISGESTRPAEPEQPNSIVVLWNTNIPATSQVAYGLSSEGPYNLDLSLPAFGYKFVTPEQDFNKIINHQVILSGLVPGEYSYRVISRASPPTVSYEHKFTIDENGKILAEENTSGNPTLAQNTGTNQFRINNSGNLGSGVSNPGKASSSDELSNTINQTATVLFGSGWLSGWKLWLWIIIAIIIALIIFFLLKKKSGSES